MRCFASPNSKGPFSLGRLSPLPSASEVLVSSHGLFFTHTLQLCVSWCEIWQWDLSSSHFLLSHEPFFSSRAVTVVQLTGVSFTPIQSSLFMDILRLTYSIKQLESHPSEWERERGYSSSVKDGATVHISIEEGKEEKNLCLSTSLAVG